MPGKELADAALVLVGGALLITPGFVTDAIGLICVVPATRPLARKFFSRLVSQRVRTVTGPFNSGFPGGFGQTPGHPSYGSDPNVVRGDVVDDDK